MKHLLLVLLIALSIGSAHATPPREGGAAWRTIAPDARLDTARPALIYFGAEWCPPCKVLETRILVEKDVQQALAGFDTVYVDGDSVDAQALMTRFGAIAFPTVIALAPGGSEVARFAGRAKKDEFIAFLAEAAAERTAEAVLARWAEGKKTRTDDWTSISSISVVDAGVMQSDTEGGVEKLAHLREQVTRAAAAMREVRPPLPAAVLDRMAVKTLILDAVSKQSSSDNAAREQALRRMLAQPASLAELTDELSYYSVDVLDFLQPETIPAKRTLARALIAMMDAEWSRNASNGSVQEHMLLQQLRLLDLGSDDIAADKQRLADRMETLITQAKTPKERLALVSGASYLLGETGHEFRAEDLVRETLKMSPDAFYLHDMLAYYASTRGDLDQAVEHGAAAFRGARNNPRAVRWGADWLDRAIERDPEDSEFILRVFTEVMDFVLQSNPPLRGYRVKSMKQFATSAGRWAVSSTHGADVKPTLAAQFGRLCDRVKDDVEQAEACTEVVKLFDTPPPETDGENEHT